MYSDPEKDKGKPKAKPPGPGGQENLHRPQPAAPPMGASMGPKPGQGMDPMEAMMFGMGGMDPLGGMGPPPPPAPMAPMGPEGLPIGGGLPSADPGMDPTMDGSSLFQALNMSLNPTGGMDPFAGPPSGHGELDPPPDLNSLLGLLALLQAGQGMDGGPGMGGMGGGMGMMGMGGGGSSGVMPGSTNPGIAQGLNPYQLLQ